MTVVYLQHTPRKRTQTKMRGSYRTPSKKREILFGLVVTAAIISLASIAAFNGGFSVEAGGLEMTLDGSMATGMQLSFASI